MKTVSIKNFRKNMKKYLDEVGISEEQWVITKYGTGHVVLLHFIEFHRLKKIEEESAMTTHQKKLKQFRINQRKTDPLFGTAKDRRKIKIPM